ncbi:MAG: F0F1 ATP synthase subunit epsilon, partial [Paracoccaceae bacterium]
FDEMLAEAKAARDKARETFQNEPGPVDDAAKLLADMVAMGQHIGLSTQQASL